MKGGGEGVCVWSLGVDGDVFASWWSYTEELLVVVGFFGNLWIATGVGGVEFSIKFYGEIGGYGEVVSLIWFIAVSTVLKKCHIGFETR